MRVLVVGGAGYVAGLFRPIVAGVHTLRIFDRRAGADVVGDATDPGALAGAMDGIDAVIHCAMTRTDQSADMFDLNVKSLYLTLDAARQAGVPHAVYISSMSVYDDIKARSVEGESVPAADARDPYGLTKRLGEAVCQAAAQEWDMTINILRLTWPTPDDVWPAWKPPWREGPPVVFKAPDGTPIHGTSATDLANAVLAALDYRNGCQIFNLSSDERLWGAAKARRLLNWTPRTV